MDSSVNPLNESPEAMQGMGVQTGSEGMILQRGGEELLLEKVSDRFTVRPTAEDLPVEMMQQIAVKSVVPVPSVQLHELVVEPDQLGQAMQLVRESAAIAFASHVYRVQDSQTFVYLTDQITLQFAGELDESTGEAIAAEQGLQKVGLVEGIPNTFIFEVTKQATENPVKIANRLMRQAEVLTAEPNVVVKTQPLYRPVDPFYPKQWYLNHSGGNALVANSHIDAEKAWDITRGVRSVIVAVPDDAFDLNHPDFQGKGKIVAPRDLKDQSSVPLPKDPQENHGTACAGIAIAEENGEGIVGVAPGCAFMPIRTTGFLDDNAVEQIFNWAVTKGASVISCSWGSSAVYFPLSLRQRASLTRAATEGRNGKGCVIVFAAGNANRPVNGTVNEQNWANNVLRGLTSWLSGFAVHPDVITVSACTSLNKKAAYSNWGANISVAAPSNNGPPSIWLEEAGYVNTAPQIKEVLPGKGVFTSDRSDTGGYSPDSFTENFGGTSSACPVVAGVAALILSVNPELTAKEVKQILQETADKIVDSSPDPQLGFSKGTYDANGHSQWFGYGKVNALKAVQMAQRRQVPAQVASKQIQQQNSEPANIPDYDPQGVTSSISISDSGTIRDIQISLEIEHEFMSDVEVSLISPKGETILLQNRTLGRKTQLSATYTLQTTPTLRRLLNQSSNGRWQLLLVDHALLNAGKLKSWRLTLGI